MIERRAFLALLGLSALAASPFFSSQPQRIVSLDAGLTIPQSLQLRVDQVIR